ncbi:hypothetical protein UT300012_22670 [Paraclostridium bifermentans]
MSCKRKRVDTCAILHGFRKRVREVEREFDNNVVDILFSKYFDKFARLSEDYIKLVIRLEAIICDANAKMEDKEKALEEYIEIFSALNAYQEVKSEIGLIGNDMDLVNSFKGCIHYDIVLEHENMLHDVLTRPAKSLGSIIDSYKKKTKLSLFDVERSKYIRLFSHKFTVVINLMLDETVNAAGREFYESGERVKQYLEKMQHETRINNVNETLEKSIYIMRNEVRARDLNTLANEYDFIKVRQKGSHAQYKHSDGRLITIPQGRVVGKGLSIKIQKDLTLS